MRLASRSSGLSGTSRLAGLAGLGGLALTSCALLACATDDAPSAAPRARLGGDSPLVEMFEAAAADTGLPAEALAAIAYVETRLSFVDADEHGATSIGVFGMTADNLAAGARLAGVTTEAARTDAAASIRAGAALLHAVAPDAHSVPEVLAALEPGLAAEVRGVLARGIDGRDDAGYTVLVAARPELRATGGFGQVVQGLGNADYAPANWVAASTSNYAVGSRGLTDITHVVIHTMEGSYAGTISWFKDPAAKVSAHYNLRSRDGDITQMVKEKDVGWHDACFNAHTVGIEHEGYAGAPATWYTEAMYASSAKLTAYLADKYGITKDRAHILGHGEAPDCSTHTDPGPGWNWAHYMDLVQTAGAPVLGASDLTVDAPAALTAGERATITVAVKNDSNIAWDLDQIRLGTAAPQDRASALFVDGDWLAPNRATAVDAVVAPGEVGTFSFDIVAPDVRAPTVIDEAFQLVQADTAWFGPEIHVILRVDPSDGPDSTATDAGCSAGGGGAGGAAGLIALGAVLARRRRRA